MSHSYVTSTIARASNTNKPRPIAGGNMLAEKGAK